MASKRKVIDPIPESFRTEEEAGQFWDTHSLADYEQFLEPVGDKIKIEKRVFEIRVSEDVFNQLRVRAKKSRKSLPKTADSLLRKQLAV